MPPDSAAGIAATIIYHVVFPRGTPRDWASGPLPVPVLLQDAASPMEVVVADSDWRRSQLLPRMAGTLIGGGSSGVDRRHRIVPDGTTVDVREGISIRLDGLEFIATRSMRPRPLSDPRRRTGVLAVHLSILEPFWSLGHPSDPRASATGTTLRITDALKALCRDLGRPDEATDFWRLPTSLQEHAGARIVAAPGYDNAYLAVLLTQDVRGGQQMTVPPTGRELDVLWHLAMASPSKGPRRSEVDSESGVVLDLPAVHVLVTRLGLVQVGKGTGNPEDPTTTNGKARSRFRSIYLDGLLMVMMQQRVLDELSDETGRLDDPLRRPQAFNRMSRQFRRFRVTWWWSDFSRWRHPDRVTQALQGQLDLDKKYRELQEDHAFFADLLRASQTSRLTLTILLLTVLSTAGVAAEIISVFGIEGLKLQIGLVAGVPSLALLVILGVMIRRLMMGFWHRS